MEYSRRKLLGIACVCACVAGISGCASSPTYHLEVGGRYESYAEELNPGLNTKLSRMTGVPVTTISGNSTKITSQGTGFSIGLTEQTGRFVTRMVGYYTRYSPVDYAFTMSGLPGTLAETLKPSAYGLDASMGYQISVFRPHISYKYEKMTMETQVSNPGGNLAASTTTTSATNFMVGGGLTLDFPINSGLHLVAQGDYRVPLFSSDNVSASVISAQAGIRFFSWTKK